MLSEVFVQVCWMSITALIVAVPVMLLLLGLDALHVPKRFSNLLFALVLLRMVFPGALPSVFTGLRLGFGYSWRALVSAELIAASSGLGYLISDASEMARTDQVFVGILMIALLGIVGDVLFQYGLKKIAPWSLK